MVFIKFGCGKGSSFPKRKLPPKDETNTFIKIHHTQLGLQLQIFFIDYVHIDFNLSETQIYYVYKVYQR